MTDNYYNRLWAAAKKKSGDKQETLVNVRIAKSSAMLGEGMVLRVQVYSQVLMGRIQMAEKEMSKYDGMSGLRNMAGILAASLAEKCCEAYKDTFDPSDYYRMGCDAFDQIVRKVEDGDLTLGMVRG
jgi:hypothetical protein